MTNLYDKSQIDNLINKQRNNKIRLIIIDSICLIVLVLLFIFINRNNKSIIEPIIFIFSIIICCFNIFYLGFYYRENRKFLSFLKQIDIINSEEYKVDSYIINKNEMTKDGLTFILIECKINESNKTFYLQKEFLSLAERKKISTIIAKDHYVYAFKEIDENE